jgi:hypothetical protein
MHRILILLFVVGLLSSVAVGEVIKSGSLQATSDGSAVTIRWVTEDETNVTQFEIQRAGVDGNFRPIASVDVKGPSLYEFVDYSAMMKTATIYQYRIQVVVAKGTNPAPTAPVTVSHTVSGVRRTWGSIKAMFR